MFLDTLDCIGRLGGGVRVKKHLRRHPSEKDVSGEWLAKIRAHVCAEYNPSRPTGITFLFSVGIFLNCLNLSFLTSQHTTHYTVKRDERRTKEIAATKRSMKRAFGSDVCGVRNLMLYQIVPGIFKCCPSDTTNTNKRNTLQ